MLDCIVMHPDGSVSFLRIAQDAVAAHEAVTGDKLWPIVVPEVVEEMRRFHHHYKHVAGVLQRKSPAEMEADASLRMVPVPEGPSEMQQMLTKQDELLKELRELPGRMAKAMIEGMK